MRQATGGLVLAMILRALPPGRYVLLVRTVDGAGNSTSKVGKKTEISVRL